MNKFLFTFLLFQVTISYSQKSSLATIPFELNEKGLMIIKLRINKTTVSNFVLDTGASVAVIDDDVANQLGLKIKTEKAKITGANAINNQVKKTEGQEIIINQKVKLKKLELYVSDLSHLGNINGIIGFDLFKEYISETIFGTKNIHFYKQINSKNTIGYQSIDFVESYCTPEVMVTFSLANGTTFSGKALFDTGNLKSPLIINAVFNEENRLTEKLKADSLTTNRGVINTKAKYIATTIDTLTFGDFTFSKIPTSISQSKEGVLAWKSYLGLLGLELISKFDFILDYRSKKIYFRQNDNFEKAFK